MTSDRGHRVIASHSIARRAFLGAAFFAVAAVVWAAVVLTRGGSWWGPLHAFVAGTILLAISGASQMFTITWAAAIPPRASVAAAQRWLIVFGVIAVLTGVTASAPILVWAGASSVVVGLVILGVSIAQTVRRSLLRRFDLSARFYLLACGAGVVGVGLGAFLGTGTSGLEFQTHRLVHSHLNLVGLVGFSIIGTIATFLPTVAHNRAVSGREAIVGWWLCVAAAALMLAGLISPAESVGAGTLLTGIAGLLILVGIQVRLRSKGRHQVPFLQVSAGTGWLIIWAFVDGTNLLLGQPTIPFSGWNAAVVLAGVGQVLAGSLAHLIPVLIGTPLASNINRMTHRPLIPLLAANLTGLALVIGWELGAVLFGAAWVIDIVIRLLGTARSARRGHAGDANN
jgi:nitrite reductase (NO-forming)